MVYASATIRASLGFGWLFLRRRLLFLFLVQLIGWQGRGGVLVVMAHDDHVNGTDAANHGHSDKYGFEETELDVHIPKLLSDQTATLVGSKVYLAGGCDAVLGNTYSPNTTHFECTSVSKSFYALDLADFHQSHSVSSGRARTLAAESIPSFETLPDMPVERYRHAAAAANGRIWIHGGRNLVSTMVDEIHVYDIELNEWFRYSGLDEKYHVSDHTGFSYQNYVYFSGGYDVNYTAVGTTFRIDAGASQLSNSSSSLVLEDRASMLVERGDIAAAATDEYAIVGGGFTHVNDFCEPHVHAERYSFVDDAWTEIASMTYGGAERVLVALNGKVYALGGERQVPDLCDTDEDQAIQAEPGSQTITLDVVERYEVDVDQWTILTNLPAYRFRFPAVGYLDLIYTFGGQSSYNSSCQCFPSTDAVITYAETIQDPTSSPAVMWGYWSRSTVLILTSTTVLASVWAWI